MNAATFIAVIAVVLALFLAGRYIYKEKKKGTACIGCPYAGTCQKKRGDTGCDAGCGQAKNRSRQ